MARNGMWVYRLVWIGWLLVGNPGWGLAGESARPASPWPVVEQPLVKPEVVHDVKDTFVSAIGGNPEALSRAFAVYLVPAVVALAIVLAGYMLASFLGRLVGQFVSTRVDLTLGKFAGRMTAHGIMVLILLGVLSRFGFDVSSFAAVLAAGGFAIGIALQGTLSNFAAGVMLLVFRPFRVNDYIKVAGVEGTVDEIDLFTTRLNSPDNRHFIVPNGQVFGSVIENNTRNEVRRVEVNVGVAYDADIRLTRRVLDDALAVIPGVVTKPAPQAFLLELGASSVNWQLRLWCQPQNYWEVRQRAIAAAKEALDLAGIQIPFPQLDLHVVAGESQLRRAA